MSVLASPRVLLERVRGALWVMPAVAVVFAITLALVLVRVQVDAGGAVEDVLFTGDADGARGLLQATITSIVTVISLTFSLTVVTLQLASSQYSPRLLRTFLRDRGTQATLSTLLSTIVYSVMVLRTIRATANNSDEFVPEVAVTVAMALLLVSIGMLVYFLNHVTSQIRVDTILLSVDTQCREVLDLIYPEAHPGLPLPARVQPPGQASMLLAHRSGFVQAVAAGPLIRLARERAVTVLVVPSTGDTVTAGTPLAWVWPARPDVPLPPVGELTKGVTDAFTIGYERTIAQDVQFGFRQMVDVASKALSPGVNDPTTAVQVIGHLTNLLCRLAGRRTGDAHHHDDDGRLLAVVRRQTFAEILDLACGQIRRYGSSEPDVAVALLDMLADVGGCCRCEPDQQLVRDQVDRVLAAAGRLLDEPADLERVRRAGQAAHDATHTTWRPGGTAASTDHGENPRIGA